MNRSFPTKNTNILLHPYELSKKTAIHEAGHVAAIYLGNKEKQLPPVFFQIYIKELSSDLQSTGGLCLAKVEGGRLIHTLPSSIQEATRHFSESEKQAYRCAFEADILNFLVGPLAEAKYVALRDNELMSPHLIDLNALQYYGGSTDLKTAHDYLDCWLTDPAQKDRKIAELFLAAYRFINDKSNWHAITALADYILISGKKIIDCEEAIAVLDAKLA
jgi:hypothetical protein